MCSNKVIQFPVEKRRQQGDTVQEKKNGVLKKLADFNDSLKHTLSRLAETEQAIRSGDVDQMRAVRDQLLRQLHKNS